MVSAVHGYQCERPGPISRNVVHIIGRRGERVSACSALSCAQELRNLRFCRAWELTQTGWGDDGHVPLERRGWRRSRILAANSAAKDRCAVQAERDDPSACPQADESVRHAGGGAVWAHDLQADRLESQATDLIHNRNKTFQQRDLVRSRRPDSRGWSTSRFRPSAGTGRSFKTDLRWRSR